MEQSDENAIAIKKSSLVDLNNHNQNSAPLSQKYIHTFKNRSHKKPRKITKGFSSKVEIKKKSRLCIFGKSHFQSKKTKKLSHNIKERTRSTNTRRDSTNKYKAKRKSRPNISRLANISGLKCKISTRRHSTKLSRLAVLQRSKSHRVPCLSPCHLIQGKTAPL